MRTSDVLAYFETQTAIAEALNIKQPSVAAWGEYPPDRRQLQLERITSGALKAEPECQARALGLPLQRAGDRQAPGHPKQGA